MDSNNLSLLSRDTMQESNNNNINNKKTSIPIPSRNWKTTLLFPAMLLLIVSLLAGDSIVDLLSPAIPVDALPVMVKSDLSDESIESSLDGEVLVIAPGWVEADPYSISVTSLADGVVEEVLVLEGESVKKDQVVARLVAEDAEIAHNRAQANLDRSKAELEIAKVVLVEAEENWEHPIELRSTWQSAKAMLRKSEAELVMWESELAEQQEMLIYLEADYNRVKDLQANQQASEIELIRARQLFKSQSEKIQSVMSRKNVLEAQIEIHRSDLWAAEHDLDLRIEDKRVLDESRSHVIHLESLVRSAEADLDEAALRLSRMEVRSPVDGQVMVRLIEPGSKVMLNMDNPDAGKVLKLYNPKKLQVRVDIPLVDASLVGVGQPAEIIVDVLPDTVFTGEVTRIVHEADLQKNTLQVKVAIHNPSIELKPEMLARARFFAQSSSSQTKNAQSSGNTIERMFVHKSALVGSGDNTYIWLVNNQNNQAIKTSVKKGTAEIDDWIHIKSGVSQGDLVIINPPATLKEGQRVEVTIK